MGLRLVVRSSWTRRSDATEGRYEFDQARVVIGRRRGADVQLPHPAVSGTHATVRAEGAGYALVDEDSTNGTRVNGSRIAPGRAKPLRAGDVLEIGGFVLRVEIGVIAGPTSAEKTAALARRLVRDALDPSAGELEAPRLRVANGPSEGRELVLPPPPASLVLGRGEECDLVLEDGDASREHAELVCESAGVRVRDLGSKNGVLRNGRPVHDVLLADRDELQLGATILVFEDAAASAVDALAAAPEEAMELPEPAPLEPEAADDADADADGDDGESPEAEAADGGKSAETGGKKGTETAGEATPEEAPEDAPEPDPATPLSSAATAPRRRAGGADLVIYVLAGTVLALSLAGLVWLLRAG